MLILQNVSYAHPNKELLFENIRLTVAARQKVALIGNNGSGKSTLLRLIAGELQPSAGVVTASSIPYFVPQLFGQFNDLTIAQALRIEEKLRALTNILAGDVSETNFALLHDDWTIEARCSEAMQYWHLGELDLKQNMASLSGGQKTKIFLAGISIHQPEIVLLDEPSNHLDSEARELLYRFIENTTATLVVVSHDRKLLNIPDTICELSKKGITAYGGNYTFYLEQKEIEANALSQNVKSKEKEIRKAKEIARETAERKQKLDARGKKKQEKAGMPTIMMNTLRNNAEKSTSRLADVHAEKMESLTGALNELRKELPDADKMKFGFDDSNLHKGKVLATASGINFGYSSQLLWFEPLTFEIISGERIALKGPNGSGKTTLIKMLTGEISPRLGNLYRTAISSVYIDQDYSLINNELKVYEQAQQFNTSGLQEHEIKIRLARFLFTKAFWDKPCGTLSGGEKMRLMLCCLTLSNQAPDMIILDEPTNNLDIQNIQILTAAINEYKGTLIVVSHDVSFLEEVNIQRELALPS